MRIAKLAFITTTLLAAPMTAPTSGQLLAYDGFGYPPHPNLAGSSGGTGWIGAWVMAGDNVTAVAITDLTWPGLATTPGSAVTPTAGGTWPNSVYRRLLPAATDDSVVYLSFLLRYDVAWGSWGGLSFGTYPWEMTVGSPLGYYTYGFMLSEGLGDVSHKPLVVGETTLVVVKVSRNTPAAGTTWRMYLDPAVGSAEPGFPDAMMSVGQIAALPGDLSIDNGTGFTTDEIRVGTTWASVLPAEPWVDLGHAKPGATGLPTLVGYGLLGPGDVDRVDLANALPSALVTLVWGLSVLEAPFKGGTLVPEPVGFVGFASAPSGKESVAFKLPAGVPAGTTLVFQAWIQDAAATKGLSASNGLLGVTP